MQEIKTCPVCGANANVTEHKFYFSGLSTFGVACNECGLSTLQMFPTAERAIEAWNRRIEDDD